MNYRSETTCIDSQRGLRKRHTKLSAPQAILTNFNDSRSIFGCCRFFAESSLGGIFEQGEAKDSQTGRKITRFLMQVIPYTLTVLSSHFRRASMRLSLSLEMMDLFTV